MLFSTQPVMQPVLCLVYSQLLLSIFLIPVTGAAQSVNVVIPDTIFAGTVRVGGCDSVTFPIFNNGKEPIRIDVVTFSAVDQVFTLSTETATVIPHIGPDSSSFVTLRFCPENIGCVANRLVVRAGLASGGETKGYQIGIGGCGGIPQGSVTTDRLNFPSTHVNQCSSLQVTVQNSGTFPLKVLGVQLTQGKSFSSPDTSQFPFALLPGEGRVVQVDFCPVVRGEVEDTLTIDDDGDRPIEPIPLSGVGVKSQFGLPTGIDFGDVPVGTEKDTVLVVQNIDGVDPLTILRSAILEGGGQFSVEDIAPNDSRLILPGKMIALRLSFRPIETGAGEGKVLLEDDQLLTAETLLTGNGVLPAVRLDTVSGLAGGMVQLTLSIDRVGDIAPQIGEYRFVLNLSPFALFPHELSGSSATMAYEADGRLVVVGNHGGSIPSDGRLFSITFRGLSTGDSANVVQISEAELVSVAPLPIAGDGLVFLSGCDVGRSERLIRKPVSLKAVPNPVADELIVSCRLPSESLPTLTLYTMLAEKIAEYDLPADMQEGVYHLPLVDVQPGTYLLELRVGTNRDVEVIVIK